MLSTRLLNHCERFYGHNKAVDRKIMNDASFNVPFENSLENILLQITAENLIASKKPIMPFVKTVGSDEDHLPDIFPLKPTVSIPKVYIKSNEEQNVYRK